MLGKSWLGYAVALVFVAAHAMGSPAGEAEAAEERVLNVYNWSDYIAEDTIANFE